MNPYAPAFIQQMTHPLKSRVFLLWKLPAAFFSGVRIKSISAEKCEVTVPYKWFSQNPFRSTYFACLAMAAEMSTGILSLMQIMKRQPAVSMLVVSLEANYFKKAVDLTTFICEDGKALEALVDEVIASGEAKSFKAKSIGRNKAGDIVAEFYITWSFKAKNN
ncbi:MAG: DUF4442 domain-containing protein [Chitinophagaceae bacterium]|jgi:hypothetical protein|nr:DUF4442 domain-containing protein [Chitinophagaceae bacterium]